MSKLFKTFITFILIANQTATWATESSDKITSEWKILEQYKSDTLINLPSESNDHNQDYADAEIENLDQLVVDQVATTRGSTKRKKTRSRE